MGNKPTPVRKYKKSGAPQKGEITKPKPGHHGHSYTFTDKSAKPKLPKGTDKIVKHKPEMLTKAFKKGGKKKILKHVGKKVASRLIPGAGWALAASDAYGVGKKMYKGASLKDAAKEQFLGIKSKKKSKK